VPEDWIRSIPKRAFHGFKVRLGIPIFFEKIWIGPAADRETKQQAVLTLVLCAIRTICKYDVVVQHSKRSTTEAMNSCLEVPDLTSPSQCVSLNELMSNV
jgi:hypothetical protein